MKTEPSPCFVLTPRPWSLVGREIESDILEAYEESSPATSSPVVESVGGPSAKLKRIVRPVYDLVCNELTKVGMTLVARGFGRLRSSPGPTGSHPVEILSVCPVKHAENAHLDQDEPER